MREISGQRQCHFKVGLEVFFEASEKKRELENPN